MTRSPNPRTLKAFVRKDLRPTLTPYEQMVRAILSYCLGLGVVSVLALCMLALALSEIPGTRP